MNLSLRTLSQFVQDMSSAIQGSAARLVDLSVGSILRALLEANASIALWLQWLISDVMQASRAATSAGVDLDSWVRDFALDRLPASTAIGLVTFSRNVANGIANVPIGTRVKTADGSAIFRVIADTGHLLWSASDRAYLLPDGQTTATVPVESEGTGASANLQAGTLVFIGSTLIGIDSVVNDQPMIGARDAENDDAFRRRFCDYINSRSRATADAIRFAVSSVRQGLEFVVHENVDATGAFRLGNFVVTVDDGSGVPSAALLTDISLAIDQVRPVGATFSVVAPIVVPVDVTMDVSIGSTAATQIRDTCNAITFAVTNYINSLPIGATLSITRIAQIGYGASTDVVNISSITVNGQPADLTPAVRTVVKADLVAVS